MKFLTFDQIQAQLRLDCGQAEMEHDLLVMYGESAETAVLNIIRRTYDELTETYGDVPTPIVQAALMLVDHFYQHRSPVNQQSLSIVPYGFDFLLKPYMKLEL